MNEIVHDRSDALAVSRRFANLPGWQAFAARPQDWIDVEKVIVRQGDRLDRELIRTELAPLVDLKEEPEIMLRLESLLNEPSEHHHLRTERL